MTHVADGSEVVDGYTEAELRDSIGFIRSLPSGYRWSWRTLRRERYGPDLTLLSWVGHAEDLLDELDRLRAATPSR